MPTPWRTRGSASSSAPTSCSAYKKVGTFRKDGDTKTGGNVASYFCLPDETVIHIIPGPVDAATFLREARLGVDVAESAALEQPGRPIRTEGVPEDGPRAALSEPTGRAWCPGRAGACRWRPA